MSLMCFASQENIIDNPYGDINTNKPDYDYNGSRYPMPSFHTSMM